MAFTVARSPEEWLAKFGDPVGKARPSDLTVGNFDGIHRGHRKILQAVVDRARRNSHLATVVTFDPHPLRVLRPEEAPPLIMTLDQRLSAMGALGLDAVLVLTFDRALSRLSPEEFAKAILADTLRAKAVLVGDSFRFGHRQSGNTEQLRRLGQQFGFDVETVPPVVSEGVVVSSTEIRSAVRQGRVARAADLLGQPFTLTGEIRPGTGQGRKLVVPTLNLKTDQELLPHTGVYVTQVRVRDELYRAATNVGVRPTFDGTHLTVESHLFDFSQELTSGALEVAFLERIRDERKFSGPESLREQIMRDLDYARDFFKSRVEG
jgi:riboflavin kinase / FMN adenylyltransferase